MKIKTNLVGGILFVIVSAILLILIPLQIAMPRIQSAGVNPQFMPRAVTIIMGICGIGLIVQSLVFKKEKILEVELKEETIAMVVAGIMLLFTVLIVKAGFLIGSFVMVATMLFYYRVKTIWPYIITFALAAGIYFMFVNLFHVGLPGIGGI